MKGRIVRRTLFRSLVSVGLIIAGQAAGGEDSNWPCVQRKVPEITAAAVWTGPPIEGHENDWRSDPSLAALVDRLAARRTPIDQAEKAIADLSAGSANPNPKLVALFAGLLETLNQERSDVIAGIERYGAHQKQLAEKLRREASLIDDKRADANADPREIADLTDQLVWDTRIFDDRQKSLSFVCEVPILIEQRLFALARSIQNALK